MKNPIKRIRMWWLKRQINKSIRVLDMLDWRFRQVGWNRVERRRFWRDFTKKQEMRTEVLNRMTQQ